MGKGKWLGAGLGASVGAAVAASLCCLGPTLVIAAGGIVTAAFGGVFEWFQAWRPVFTALSLGFLAVGYWYVFKSAPPEKADCERGVCTPRNPVNKTVLAVLTLVVAVLITAPYWLTWVS